MTKRTRRTHNQGFKAKAALAALKGEKTLAELDGAGHYAPGFLQDHRHFLHPH